MSTMTRTTHASKKSPSPPPQKNLPAPAPAPAPAAWAPIADVNSDRIRERAYELFQIRCCKGAPGDDLGDWLQAEQELGGSAPDPAAFNEIELKAQARGERLLASDD